MTSNTTSRILLQLGVAILLYGTAAFSQANWVNGTLITFNTYGAWCWYQDERAVVDIPNQKLLIASNRTNGGHDFVDIYNLATKTNQEYDLGSIGSDDHNAPGLIIRPDGKYLAMYAAHYDAYYSHYKIFNGTSWSAEQKFNWSTIPGGTDYTIAYSNLCYLSAESRMYNFARANDRAANFLVSSDEGTTWTFGGQLKTNVSDSYNKGYFKYWGNGVDRIDFICTEQHPRDTYSSMYHAYIQNGKIYRSDGTVADNDVFDRSFICTDDDLTKIFADNTVLGGYTMRRIWNADLVRYNDGTMAAILTARTDTPDGADASINPQHAFIYCRFDGSAWTPSYLCRAGQKLYSSEADYTGLGALCPNDPNTLYVSTTYSPIDNTFLTKHEIFKGVTTDHGATWTWTAMTKNSTVDNLRPIVPSWDPGHTALLWFRGTYTSAQNVNAAVVGLIMTDPNLPVELTAFTAELKNGAVGLQWETATEVNNHGFDVERRAESVNAAGSRYEKIGFVNGSGTSNAPTVYRFDDKSVLQGSYCYRLKQVDNDGSFTYSKEIEVVLGVPGKLSLAQNFPNPFNPTTSITFSVDASNETTLKVYTVLGQDVATLFSGRAIGGTRYTMEFNAAGLASGMYYYVLKSGAGVETKKFIVAK